MPRICSNGEWQTMIIDCQEAMAPETCESGIFIPAEEGECCSTCYEGKYAQCFFSIQLWMVSIQF